MSDLISRHDAIETIRKLPNAGIHWFVSAKAVFDALLKLPSAQPEIVRCKDCKHWDGEKRGQFWYFEQCSLNQHIASCDDYCSFAERREE